VTPGTGSLSFRLRADGARTVAERCAARSPLKLLTPKNHGSSAWVFSASLGGGLVDGDTVTVDAQVHPGARALLGTQASTKVYRSESIGCRQTLAARVAEGGSLVVLPDPVSPFAGSRFTQRSEVHLAEGASLLLVDAFSCGRVAHGERWDLARYASTTQVHRGDALLLHDAVLLDPAHGALAERMGRIEAFATLSLFGERFRPIVEAVLAANDPLSRRPDVLVSANRLVTGAEVGAVVRLAAISVERLTTTLRTLLRNLPEILGDDPFARKW
jgi:urease accessory protein